MADSEGEAIPESDVTPVGEETLDFHDDTSKGEDSCYYRSRSHFKTGLKTVLLYVKKLL